MVTNIYKYQSDYFVASPEKEADIEASAKLTKTIDNEFKDVFSGIGCSQGTFSLHVKEEIKPCQGLPRHMAHMLQNPFKEELESLPLGADKMLA